MLGFRGIAAIWARFRCNLGEETLYNKGDFQRLLTRYVYAASH